MRMRRLCLKTSKAAGQGGLGITGLQAYALTLPILGFKFTWYEIKSRDMNEKGKEFIFYNKPYICLQQAFMVHCTWHGMCTLPLLPALTPALNLHAHTQWPCLLLLGQRGGGVHVLKYILLILFERLTYHYP